MLYAVRDNNKILAYPKERAECPACGSTVISKCGNIIVWHWAHLSNIDCDPWYEPEKEWHLKWKGIFSPEYVEVSINEHRPDVFLPYKQLWEFQFSPISSNEIKEREDYYHERGYALNWLFEVSRYIDNIEFNTHKGSSKNIWFRWKRPHLTMGMPRRALWDIGDKIFYIKHLSRDCSFGYGEYWSYEFFISRIFRRYLKRD